MMCCKFHNSLLIATYLETVVSINGSNPITGLLVYISWRYYKLQQVTPGM